MYSIHWQIYTVVRWKKDSSHYPNGQRASPDTIGKREKAQHIQLISQESEGKYCERDSDWLESFGK